MNDRPDAITISRGTGAGRQSVSASTTSARTAADIGSNECLIYSTVECFGMAGDSSVVATVAEGTPIPANTLVRLRGVIPNGRIAFITASGTGTVYVRPGA